MWILSFRDVHRFLADRNGYPTGGRTGMAIGQIRTPPGVMTAESARPSRATTSVSRDASTRPQVGTALRTGRACRGVYITARCGVCPLSHRLAIRRHSMSIKEFPPRPVLGARTTNPRQTRGEAMQTTFEAAKG